MGLRAGLHNGYGNNWTEIPQKQETIPDIQPNGQGAASPLRGWVGAAVPPVQHQPGPCPAARQLPYTPLLLRRGEGDGAEQRGQAAGDRVRLKAHCREKGRDGYALSRNNLCPRCRCSPQSDQQKSKPSRSNTLPALLALLFSPTARSSSDQPSTMPLVPHIQKHPCTKPDRPVTLQLGTVSLVHKPSGSCPAARSKQAGGGCGPQDTLQSELDSGDYCPPIRHHLEEAKLQDLLSCQVAEKQ